MSAGMNDAPRDSGTRDRPKKRRTWLIVALVGLLLFIPLTALLLSVAVPVYRSKIIIGNEAAALQTLRAIAVAQERFLSANGRYATFDELVAAGALDPRLAGSTPVLNGYRFMMNSTPAAADGQPPVFSINADPQPGAFLSPTGVRHFYFASNVSGIRVNDERPANASDRPRT